MKLKYKAWVENEWKDGNNKVIRNWKSKLLNTIPYFPKSNQKSEVEENDQSNFDT